MLTKVDRMSMAHSLETRVPFLDHRLIELCWGVDKNLKMPGHNAKNLLKKTYARRLPRAVLKAPKKPFSVPLREWFKQKNFEKRLNELQEADFGLNRVVIKDIVDANRSGREDYGNFIWRLFVLKKCLNKCRGNFTAVKRHTHPVATQVPLFIDINEDGKILLSGHIMRKTDHHKAFEKNENVLVLFTGPHSYVSASWYTAPQTASTWNYMTVHVKGKISLLDETLAPVIVWKVKNAWPVKVQSTDLKADGNEVAIESIELAHEGLTIQNE